MKPQVEIDGCRAAHQRLFITLETVTDEVARRPCLLPGWTVGHLLTHIARNADSVLRRLDGAMRDEVVDQYLGGSSGRAADIDAGAGRPAKALVADVRDTAAAVDIAWDRLSDAMWDRLSRSVSGNLVPASALAFSRWREVEVHHVDLGLAFGYDDWSEGYVAAELPRALATVPGRLSDLASRRQLCAWLLDRTSSPARLDSWG